MWTIISGIFGGLLRLAPEVFKYFNAKAEMKHELEMQKVAYDFQVLKGKQEVDMILEKGSADYASKGLDALTAAIKEQGKQTGIRWIDAINALVRPTITFQWVIVLYPAVLIATFVILVMQTVPPHVLAAIKTVFGPEEKALVVFIVDFYFIGRVLDAGRKKYGS